MVPVGRTGIEDATGDKAIISGLATAAAIIATIEAMLSDTAGYAIHHALHGDPAPIETRRS